MPVALDMSSSLLLTASLKLRICQEHKKGGKDHDITTTFYWGWEFIFTLVSCRSVGLQSQSPRKLLLLGDTVIGEQSVSCQSMIRFEMCFTRHPSSLRLCSSSDFLTCSGLSPLLLREEINTGFSTRAMMAGSRSKIFLSPFVGFFPLPVLGMRNRGSTTSRRPDECTCS